MDHEKMINALRDIAEYFRTCRKNAASNGAAARRFEIYVEAAEDAAELLKAQEQEEDPCKNCQEFVCNDCKIWIEKYKGGGRA